jgi:K+-transporting ATPase c subunit
MKQWIIAIKITVVLTVVTGLLYPFLATGLAQVMFP